MILEKYIMHLYIVNELFRVFAILVITPVYNFRIQLRDIADDKYYRPVLFNVLELDHRTSGIHISEVFYSSMNTDALILHCRLSCAFRLN